MFVRNKYSLGWTHLVMKRICIRLSFPNVSSFIYMFMEFSKWLSGRVCMGFGYIYDRG